MSDTYTYGFLVECAVGCLFGGVHVAAWNFAGFQTDVEKWIWRSSALAVTGIPFLALILAALAIRYKLSEGFKANILMFIVFSLIVFYVVARLLLLGLAFAAFRALPERMLEDVDWSIWFPHIS
jgi:hypothetical protein